jgi:hypothetical protein
MLGKLKSLAGNGLVQKAVDTMAPSLSEHLEKVKSLDPAIIHDDEQFTSKVINPAYLAVSASTSGVASLVPKFKEKFHAAFLHLRDEIIHVEDGKVSLAEGYQSKIGPALLEGLKK